LFLDRALGPKRARELPFTPKSPSRVTEILVGYGCLVKSKGEFLGQFFEKKISQVPICYGFKGFLFFQFHYVAKVVTIHKKNLTGFGDKKLRM